MTAPRVMPNAEDQTYLWDMLERARKRVDPTIGTADTTPSGGSFPRYPTGLLDAHGGALFDKFMGGGLYGLTAIVGAPKAKKSVLAGNMIALETAADGWDVRYVSCELAPWKVYERAAMYLGLGPGQEGIERLALEAPWWFRDHWGLIDMTDPPSLDRVITLLQRSLPEAERQTDNLLIVVDSVSRFAEESPGDYFGNLKALWGFLRRLVKISNGNVAAVGVVEMNQRGGAKGGGAEYACDVMLRMERDDATGRVEIVMSASRDTASPKPNEFSNESDKAGSFGYWVLQPDRWRLRAWEEVGKSPLPPAEEVPF